MYEDFFQEQIVKKKRDHSYRVFKKVNRLAQEFPWAYEYSYGENSIQVWCSNDYLGMSRHPEVKNAVRWVFEKYMKMKLDDSGLGIGEKFHFYWKKNKNKKKTLVTCFQSTSWYWPALPRSKPAHVYKCKSRRIIILTGNWITRYNWSLSNCQASARLLVVVLSFCELKLAIVTRQNVAILVVFTE